jgi:redox-regulated HSP33 family molecular chaperone
MLSAHDLTEMIAKGSPVEVTCDFCRTVYTVGVEDMRTAHATLIQTKN